MKTGIFIFDVNKCVGCMACVVGCSVSKTGADDQNWRTVNKFNPYNHPDLPVFCYSLACNHCEKAPCLEACPAKAYYRDKVTGAVIHDESKCIGCKYCTWVCPYDAPKYNDSTHTVEKCNFCIDLMRSGDKPSCTYACPTGALSFGSDDRQQDESLLRSKPHAVVEPRLRVIQSLGKISKPEIMGCDLLPESLKVELIRPRLNKKITAIKEWPLVIFSMLMPFLIAWILSSFTHQIEASTVIFYPLILVSGVISMLHLGKKTRSWRALLNIKSSWLSREIASYCLFVILAAIYSFTNSSLVGYGLLMASALFLISLDFIYLNVRPVKEIIHSSSTVITSLLWWSIFTGEFKLTLLISLIKTILYIYRSRHQVKEGKVLAFTSSRVILMAGAVTFLYLYPSFLILNLILFLAGEVIDRIEFYNEAHVVTPELLLNEKMDNFLDRK